MSDYLKTKFKPGSSIKYLGCVGIVVKNSITRVTDFRITGSTDLVHDEGLEVVFVSNNNPVRVKITGSDLAFVEDNS